MGGRHVITQLTQRGEHVATHVTCELELRVVALHVLQEARLVLAGGSTVALRTPEHLRRGGGQREYLPTGYRSEGTSGERQWVSEG